MVQLFIDGGGFMWPILGIGAIGLIFVGERLYHLISGLQANESFAIARHPRTRYCEITESGCQRLASRRFQLPADYYTQNWPVVKHRLALAGIRLAELLNRVLAAPLAGLG
mgnify:CR=1 FL=1